jgi:hypothetical protein
MAFDEKNRSVILFGGRTPQGFLNDTWQFKKGVWQRVGGEKPPPARAFPGLTFEPGLERLLLFGGWLGADELYGDTWSLQDGEWKEIRTAGPSKRLVYSMVYDRNNGVAFFFGGGHRSESGWVLHNETWVWNGKAWSLK